MLSQKVARILTRRCNNYPGEFNFKLVFNLNWFIQKAFSFAQDTSLPIQVPGINSNGHISKSKRRRSDLNLHLTEGRVLFSVGVGRNEPGTN